MEKLRFAIQVITFTMALPVYFYVELSHDTNKDQVVAKKETTTEVNYTKNGRDRTPIEAANGALESKTVSIQSFN